MIGDRAYYEIIKRNLFWNYIKDVYWMGWINLEREQFDKGRRCRLPRKLFSFVIQCLSSAERIFT